MGRIWDLIVSVLIIAYRFTFQIHCPILKRAQMFQLLNYSPHKGVLCASFFCDIGLREITMICRDNHHTKHNQNIPKVKFITAKNQRISHCFSIFYRKSFKRCTRKNNNYMQTDQLHNYSQSNSAFIIEQKSLGTARLFQEPNLKQLLFLFILNSESSKHIFELHIKQYPRLPP